MQAVLTNLTAKARTLEVDVTKYPVVPLAEEKLARIVATRAAVAKAMAAVQEDLLVHAVQYAESFNFDHHEEVVSCKALRDKVLQLNCESRQCMEQVDPAHMKVLIERAEEIKLNTAVSSPFFPS